MAGTPIKSLVALATEKVLLKTSGTVFLQGVAFMYSAGLSPDRVSIMMTDTGKYILQFHSKCDIRPFAANYATFTRVLRGLVHIRAWKLRSIEFVNVPFDAHDITQLERTIDKIGVELVLLRNCRYPGIAPGDQAVRFLQALNRNKKAVVCEYGDDRLKSRISVPVPPPQMHQARLYQQNQNAVDAVLDMSPHFPNSPPPLIGESPMRNDEQREIV